MIRIGWPQAIYIALTLVGLVYAGIQHGRQREPRNAWHDLFGSAVAWALLWFGGFFG